MVAELGEQTVECFINSIMALAAYPIVQLQQPPDLSMLNKLTCLYTTLMKHVENQPYLIEFENKIATEFQNVLFSLEEKKESENNLGECYAAYKGSFISQFKTLIKYIPENDYTRSVTIRDISKLVGLSETELLNSLSNSNVSNIFTSSHSM